MLYCNTIQRWQYLLKKQVNLYTRAGCPPGWQLLLGLPLLREVGRMLHDCPSNFRSTISLFLDRWYGTHTSTGCEKSTKHLFIWKSIKTSQVLYVKLLFCIYINTHVTFKKVIPCGRSSSGRLRRISCSSRCTHFRSGLFSTHSSLVGVCRHPGGKSNSAPPGRKTWHPADETWKLGSNRSIRPYWEEYLVMHIKKSIIMLPVLTKSKMHLLNCGFFWFWETVIKKVNADKTTILHH